MSAGGMEGSRRSWRLGIRGSVEAVRVWRTGRG